LTIQAILDPEQLMDHLYIPVGPWMPLKEEGRSVGDTSREGIEPLLNKVVHYFPATIGNLARNIGENRLGAVSRS